MSHLKSYLVFTQHLSQCTITSLSLTYELFSTCLPTRQQAPWEELFLSCALFNPAAHIENGNHRRATTLCVTIALLTNFRHSWPPLHISQRLGSAQNQASSASRITGQDLMESLASGFWKQSLWISFMPHCIPFPCSTTLISLLFFFKDLLSVRNFRMYY